MITWLLIASHQPVHAGGCDTGFVEQLPESGSTEVPVNVVPRFVVMGDPPGPDAELVSSDPDHNGPAESIPVRVQLDGQDGHHLVSLFPPADLAPETRYDVVIDEFHRGFFVTGSTRDDDPPPTPVFSEIRRSLRGADVSFEPLGEPAFLAMDLIDPDTSTVAASVFALTTGRGNGFVDAGSGGCDEAGKLRTSSSYVLRARALDAAGNNSPDAIDEVRSACSIGPTPASLPPLAFALGLVVVGSRRRR